MKAGAWIAIGAVFVGLYWLSQQVEKQKDEDERSLLHGMDRAIADIKPTLPKETAPGITMVNYSRQDKVMYSDLRIANRNVTNSDVQALRSDYIKRACDNKDLREGMTKHGISGVYRYSDENGKLIGRFTIAGEDCK